MQPARENTLGRVTHPEFLRDPQGITWQLIDDPLADRIAKGDATFGWEGDERYALYHCPRRGLWSLFRLEADNVMRQSVEVPGFVSGVECVAWLIKWIVDHDTRRGFDPAEFVIKESVRTQKARDAVAHDRNEEAADALHFGLLRDVGHLHGGLTRRLHAVPGPDTTAPDADPTPAPPDPAPPAPAPAVPERTTAP